LKEQKLTKGKQMYMTRFEQNLIALEDEEYFLFLDARNDGKSRTKAMKIAKGLS